MRLSAVADLLLHFLALGLGGVAALGGDEIDEEFPKSERRRNCVG